MALSPVMQHLNQTLITFSNFYQTHPAGPVTKTTSPADPPCPTVPEMLFQCTISFLFWHSWHESGLSKKWTGFPNNWDPNFILTFSSGPSPNWPHQNFKEEKNKNLNKLIYFQNFELNLRSTAKSKKKKTIKVCLQLSYLPLLSSFCFLWLLGTFSCTKSSVFFNIVQTRGGGSQTHGQFLKGRSAHMMWMML